MAHRKLCVLLKIINLTFFVLVFSKVISEHGELHVKSERRTVILDTKTKKVSLKDQVDGVYSRHKDAVYVVEAGTPGNPSQVHHLTEVGQAQLDQGGSQDSSHQLHKQDEQVPVQSSDTGQVRPLGIEADSPLEHVASPRRTQEGKDEAYGREHGQGPSLVQDFSLGNESGQGQRIGNQALEFDQRGSQASVENVQIFDNAKVLGQQQKDITLDETTNTRLCSQDERKSHMRAKCESRGLLQWDKMTLVSVKQLPNLLVDDRHQVMYCPVAKVASTAWMRQMMVAVKPDSPPHADNQQYGQLRYLHSYTKEEVKDKLHSYLKLVVSRHPYDRMVSMWRRHLQGISKSAQTKRSIAAMTLEKLNSDYNHPDSGSNRLEDFLVNTTGSRRPKKSPRIKTYLHKCKPCLVHYDYISRTETSHVDSQPLMERLGFDLVPLPVWRPNQHQDSMFKVSSVLWPFSNVSAQQLGQLSHSHFQVDMDIFGYSYDDKTWLARCHIKGYNGASCC